MHIHQNQRGDNIKKTLIPIELNFKGTGRELFTPELFADLNTKPRFFINHEGDHYRTRLTHTIEVSQIARTIARALKLNEDLSESIALAHDLGHTPFGHAGEEELNDILKDNGGFEHNRQSLRVVDVLEKRYPNFEGLNLTWETREGIIKHSSPYDNPDAKNFSPYLQPSLEAQIIDLADEIAYNNHDLDDGITSGILTFDEVESLKIWQMAKNFVGKNTPSDKKLLLYAMIRAIINLLVTDLIESITLKINEKKIESYKDITEAQEKIAGFSPEIEKANSELKNLLRSKLYNHYRVARMTIKAQKVIRELFQIYTEHPDTLPDSYQAIIPHDGILLTTADYIAGMTDRFALEEHKKLTDPMIRV